MGPGHGLAGGKDEVTAAVPDELSRGTGRAVAADQPAALELMAGLARV